MMTLQKIRNLIVLAFLFFGLLPLTSFAENKTPCPLHPKESFGKANLVSWKGTEITDLGHPWETVKQLNRVYSKVRNIGSELVLQHQTADGALTTIAYDDGSLSISLDPNRSWMQNIHFPRLDLTSLHKIFHKDDISTLETYLGSVLDDVESRGRDIQKTSFFIRTENEGPQELNHRHQNKNLVVYGYTAIGKGTQYLANGKEGPPKSVKDYSEAPTQSTVIITREFHRAPVVRKKRLYLGVLVYLVPL